jgi:hypothetical protein
VDRGKRGIKRSVVVDGRGIPLGCLTAPANRHDSPLLAPTLDAARTLGLWRPGLERPPGPRLRLGAHPEAPARARPYRGGLREGEASTPERDRTLGRRADQLLAECPQEALVVHRAKGAVDFWVALSEVIIIVRRLVREGWNASAGKDDPPDDHRLSAEALSRTPY